MLAAATARVQAMLFYSFFKTLVGKEIVVELKNGAAASQLAWQRHNFP